MWKVWCLVGCLVGGWSGAARAANWTVERYDCHSAAGWVETNTATLLVLGKAVLPLVSDNTVQWLGQTVGISTTWVPFATGQANEGWTGVMGGLFGGFLSLGASPVAFVNAGLHLVCVDAHPDGTVVEGSDRGRPGGLGGL